ncbi:hypothetical protein VR41_05635 [Streptomyces sp. NRRL B-1568]|uniref:Putative OB-fold protein n=1 Tax=Streptomyces olivoverticillatus TaxID=66427 RepID=A0A7W7LPT1_9ACTN|nr:DUF1876 domain-containing protein [Streptomyces olivoverticillatus]KJY42935.1 hypothetical protein VR41_05635 [Streptomyces sp. NRRL B-1568]MBB4893593.1 putative OB-fold protein [Streptomyces olivoverticillatus]
MQTIVGWHVEVEFEEVEKRTRAAAMLRLPDGTEMRARAHATRHPDDPEQLRVGEEVAAARALNELSRELLDKAGRDIEEVTHVKAHPAM